MIEVVAAVIEYQGKLLVFRRGTEKFGYLANKFEFPGGKVESGEDQKSALARELLEELHLDVVVDDFIETVEHTYPDFSIKMHCFLVRLTNFHGELTEHTEFAHVRLSEAKNLEWIEADKPVLRTLAERYTHVFSE